MELPKSCKEIFVEGITDVFAYHVTALSLPMPFSVPLILSMNNVSLPKGPALHISLADETTILASEISVKISPNIEPSGSVFIFNISSNIENGSEIMPEIYKNMCDKDFYIVLKNMEGSLFLCYTLPNTFNIQHPQTLVSNGSQRSVNISLKSLSELIPIQIKAI